MPTNRRLWLKQMGLGLAGLTLPKVQSFQYPDTKDLSSPFVNDLEKVLLSSNENPYGPSPLVIKEITKNISLINRYQWDLSWDLIQKIAEYNKVGTENILLGAGSTEILEWVAMYVASSKGNYVIADPSYDYWTSTLNKMGLTKIRVPLTKDKSIDLKGMLNAIDKDTKIVYICNPNNPSGTICNRNSLKEFISNVPAGIIIFVDEAYLNYTDQDSLTSEINNFSNLIITKTFSKIFGLAGARIGYAVSNKETIDKLSQLPSAPTNTVSVLSKIAAITALQDNNFVQNCLAKIKSVKQFSMNEFKKMDIECIPSNTNFIYFSLANFTKDYFHLLKENSIEGTKIYEEEGKWTRITIGTMKEMKYFFEVISS